MPAQPNSSPMDGSIISVCASGIVLAKPSPTPCPVVPPLAIAQMPLATWSPPNTSLFQASCQMALRSTKRSTGPGNSVSKKGTWSSNKKPAMSTMAMMADSLACLRRKNMVSNNNATAMAVASQMFVNEPYRQHIHYHSTNHK